MKPSRAARSRVEERIRDLAVAGGTCRASISPAPPSPSPTCRCRMNVPRTARCVGATCTLGTSGPTRSRSGADTHTRAHPCYTPRMDRHAIAGSLVVMAAKHRRYAGGFHAVAARNRRVAMRTDDIDASAAICELADALDAAADMVAMQGQAEALVSEILKA